MGTVRPAYLDGFGITFVSLHPTFPSLCLALVRYHGNSSNVLFAASIDTLIKQRSAQFVSLLTTSTAATRLELVVFFLTPSSKPTTTPRNETTPTSTDKPSTVAQAAGSLRAWAASTRNYQYGWLAQAFSSGVGQPVGTYVPPQTQEVGELEGVEREAFEKWSITFEIGKHGKDGGEGEKGGVKREMESFVEKVLAFVEGEKEHLPAIQS